MKDKSEARHCTICNCTIRSGVKKNNRSHCTSCQRLLDAVKKNPAVLTRLIKHVGVEEPKASVEKELPEVLDAKRYRTSDREKNTWYVSVSELGGSPVEIFASTALDKDQHLQSRISNLTTITRLISLILRHVFMGEKLTLEKTLIQLRRSSRQRDDLPYMLSRVLANYSQMELEEPDMEKKE